MFTDPWQFGLVVVLIGTNLAVSYWLYRQLQDTGRGSVLGLGGESRSRESLAPERPGDDAGEPTATDHDADRSASVACPACGTPNDPEYRFCRACVAELAASTTAGGGAGGRSGGLPR
jgi:hypothetical protein